MGSAAQPYRSDLTTRALIREEALRLFADLGPDRVTVRQIAAAVGVSPGLVIHHYGSKQGLQAAVDAHVVAVFDDMFAAVADSDWRTASGRSFAEMIMAGLPAASPVPGYLRRLVLSSDPAGRHLFRRLYETSRRVLGAMAEARVIRSGPDPAVQAAFVMVNDLAVLLLRDHLHEVLGTDPLSPPGMSRWIDAALTVYRDGLFRTEEDL